MKFPRVKATSLARKEYLVPDDLEGEYNLVLVAFKQWHQDLVDTWIPSLQSLAFRHPQLRVYEMPTMSRLNGLYRALIDNGMRAGIPDQKVRASTLCAYFDVEAFVRAIDRPNTETIHLFLVDRAGEVGWQGSGQFDPKQLAELNRVLELRLTSA